MMNAAKSLERCCEHNGIITPNAFEGSDSQRIALAIQAARGAGNKVVIPAWNANGTFVWSVDHAILLPSDMTVVLDNCTLKLSDRCRDNLFRSDNVGIGITHPGWNRNISIIGVGDVHLYGADHPRATGDGAKRLSLTPDEDREREKEYHISYGTDAGKAGEKQTSDWRNIMILMAYVKGFTLRNVHIHCPHAWSISFERTWNADIGDIRFDNPGTRLIDGHRRRMLNMDGINLRHGCKNFRIENISGYIEEDCIAISSLDSGNKAAHVHGGLDSTMVSPALWQGPEDDSEQIFISNVQTGITGVAIWASGQAGVHNVYINDVTSLLSRGLEHTSWKTLSFMTGRYGELSAPGKIRDIYAMNFSGAGTALIRIDAPVANCCFMNGILRGGGNIIDYSDRVKDRCANVVLNNVVRIPEFETRFDREWVIPLES